MSAAAGIVVLVGRVVFALFFVVAAMGHFTRREQMVGYARSVGFPAPALAWWPSGVWLLAGAVSVALGAWPDVGVLILAAWSVPTLWWFHPFWKVEDEQQRMTQMQLFWRNVTFLGAAVTLFGLFATLGDQLRYTLTAPLFSL